jgi:hypothetical protein
MKCNHKNNAYKNPFVLSFVVFRATQSLKNDTILSALSLQHRIRNQNENIHHESCLSRRSKVTKGQGEWLQGNNSGKEPVLQASLSKKNTPSQLDSKQIRNVGGGKYN